MIGEAVKWTRTGQLGDPTNHLLMTRTVRFPLRISLPNRATCIPTMGGNQRLDWRRGLRSSFYTHTQNAKGKRLVKSQYAGSPLLLSAPWWASHRSKRGLICTCPSTSLPRRRTTEAIVFINVNYIKYDAPRLSESSRVYPCILSNRFRLLFFQRHPITVNTGYEFVPQ
ncbi:uncharacterized protein BDW43DRAFT_158069 [Aspergillus alliaceus]|uniref:uncharacterized protein n=1 Tax=Petromyces alliaceus TaxID=209559 RepID=UPI0012A6FE64|nr:uncharacterized protein BDW43DRAFT_158069 [Aspergillus alliaceus]KAB8230718.1 hypothetical protein BDW43DRAFT_158069 [Aspergillus alliaceus]